MIFVHLTPPELAHLRDLYGGLGYFKLDPNLDAKGKRERTIAALESVLSPTNVRTIIGEHDVSVRPRKADEPRFHELGGPLTQKESTRKEP